MSEPVSAFATRREVPAIEDCFFYHSMTIPGHGEVDGHWDLRGRERDYLGNVDLAGKKVLEIGTASGHLCFWMEQQGADVVAYDVSEEQEWDIVPYHNYDYAHHIAQRKAHLRKINNAWWFAHNRFNSRAQVAYGTAYELSPRLGNFDIVTMGSILLHLRDPFLAMQKAANLAQNTMVITDMLPLSEDQALANPSGGRIVRFLPDARTCLPHETWWHLSPYFIAEVAKILGFPDIRLSVHRQRHKSGEKDLYTLVANRQSDGQVPDHEGERNGWDALTSSYEDQLDRIPGRLILKQLGLRIRKRLHLSRPKAR